MNLYSWPLESYFLKVKLENVKAKKNLTVNIMKKIGDKITITSCYALRFKIFRF